MVAREHTVTIVEFPPERAVDRVRAYLEARGRLGGLDQEVLHMIGAGGRIYNLTASDLRTIVLQAEALHHQAPHGAQSIEIGPS